MATGDPVPGAEETRAGWLDKIKGKIPAIDVDRKKLGGRMKTAGKIVLYGAAGAGGAIAFIARPILTLAVGGTLVVAGKALESEDEIQEAKSEAAAAAAGA